MPESEQLDQLLGSLAEAVKAVAGFTRVSGVPDYRKDWDKEHIYKVRAAYAPSVNQCVTCVQMLVVCGCAIFFPFH